MLFLHVEVVVFFFFSSRRRHTRLQGDWSSDVCSSDLPYLEQLGSWGGAARDLRGWSATHVYFALIPGHDLILAKGANAADVSWFAVDELLREPALAFDHGEILRAAVERLRGKVEYTSLPAFLLPEPFTLPQLQQA